MGKRSARASQAITDLTSATGLTNPEGDYCLVQAQGGNVRWRDDGTSPDGSTGFLIADGDYLKYDADMTAIEFIESDAGAAVFVGYYDG